MYSPVATILQVLDMRASIDFYVNPLGFNCSFEWEDPPTYAVLGFEDRIHIHLSLADAPPSIDRRARLSFFVYDVDQLYEDLKSKNVNIHTPIGTRDYGMRDFDILDNTGYLITFGQYVGG